MGSFWSSPQWTAEAKHVLITGASAGIGAQLAREFSRAGASVALIARSTDKLATVAEECRTLGSPRQMIYACDLSDSGQIRKAIGDAVLDFGHFDVVVLNAGRSQGCYFEEIQDTDQVDYMLRLNVNGVINTLHHILPSVPKASSSRLVVISSVAGLIGVPYYTVYCASKHALTGFANSLRMELADTYGHEAPKLTLVNFPEVSGTQLNTGRMDFGADRPPAEFHAKGILSVEAACRGAMVAIARGARECGSPLRISIPLLFYRWMPATMDAITLRIIHKTHSRPDKRET
jgi:short-subunit dehydrogenase